ARGARGSQKRFAGGLELFTRYRLTVSRKSDGMGNLQLADAESHLNGISSSLVAVAVASCGLELVRELVHEGEAQDLALDGLWYFLQQIEHVADDNPRLLLALRWLEMQMLATQGQGLELSACLRCGEVLDPEGETFFS